MDNIQEIWKDVVGYEGIYKISSIGRLMRLKGFGRLSDRINLPYTNEDGYYVYGLCRGGKIKLRKAHRLVAIHFIENPLNKPTVNHLDGNKVNNNHLNLEWASYKEQSDHAVGNGLNRQRFDISKKK